MSYLHRLRQKLGSRITDDEFLRYWRFAYNNNFERIPVAYRGGFEIAAQNYKAEQNLPYRLDLAPPGAYRPDIESQMMNIQDPATQRSIMAVEQGRQTAALTEQYQRLRENQGWFWNGLNMFSRFYYTIAGNLIPYMFDLDSPTGQLWYSITRSIGGQHPFGTDPTQTQEFKRWQEANRRALEVLRNRVGEYDFGDFFALSRSFYDDPNFIQNVIRQGKPTATFDVFKADIHYPDGKRETKWITPLEKELLENRGAYVNEYEGTRKNNLERFLGMNTAYLRGFFMEALFDPLNLIPGAGVATRGVGLVRQPLRTLLSVGDEVLQAFTKPTLRNIGKGAAALGETALGSIMVPPFYAPLYAVGQLTGLAQRKLPLVVEAAKFPPILQHPIVRGLQNISNEIQSTLLAGFFNVETGHLPNSQVRSMLRPLLGMGRDERRQFVATASQKATQLTTELAQEGADLSDESWDFIKKTTHINADPPVGSRKQWLMDNGKMKETADTAMRWLEPPPVVRNFAEYGDFWKPAVHVYRGTLMLKSALEGVGKSKNSLFRKMMYPAYRLLDEGSRTAEEIGREVRQAQQAVLETQRRVSVAMSDAVAGNPNYERSFLGKVVSDLKEAEAALGQKFHKAKDQFANLLQNAALSITDETSQQNLAQLWSDAVGFTNKDRTKLMQQIENITLRKTDAAMQAADNFLRQRGIVVANPENAFDVLQMIKRSGRQAEPRPFATAQNIPQITDEEKELWRIFTQRRLELQRMGLTPEMGYGIDHLYHNMRTIYDSLPNSERAKVQGEINRLMTQLMTNQEVDPRNIQRFFDEVERLPIPETSKQLMKEAVVSAAQYGTTREITIGAELVINEGYKRMREELEKAQRRKRVMETLFSQNQTGRRVLDDGNPCL